MEREHLLRVLQSNNNINLLKYEITVEGKFNRIFEFEVRGITYQIEWWKNICYLLIGEVRICFYKVEINGYWPNRFKNNINFYDNEGGVIAIIPLEEYENKNQ